MSAVQTLASRIRIDRLSKFGLLGETNRLSFLLLAGTVAVAPFPYGSTDLASISVWCIVLGTAMVFVRPARLRLPHIVVLGGIALLIAAYAVVIHEQVSATPWFVGPHPIWMQARQWIDIAPPDPGATLRHQPLYTLGAPIANTFALTLGLLIGTTETAARRLFKVFAWSGVAYAAYAIPAFIYDPTSVLFREKLGHTASLTGTFLNRNTAAVFFGSCGAIWLIMICRRINRRLQPGTRGLRRLQDSLVVELKPASLLPYLALGLCIVAMFMTRSRAGVAISLAVFVLIIGITFRTHLRGAKQLLLAAIATMVTLAVLFDLVGGGVGSRFSYEGLDDAGRIETYRSTLDMIRDNPLIGSGLGTYAWSYPEYRSGDVPIRGVWDRAHSTPLELAAELGIPLAAGIIAGWIGIIALLSMGTLSARRSSTPIMGAWAIVLIGSFHSLIDFSFQIPGFSIPLCALAGAGLAQTFSNTRSLSRQLHISDTSHRQAAATNVP